MRTLWLIIVIAGCRIPDERYIKGDGEEETLRLIAPLSMTTVTQQTPTLRWVMGPGDTAPVVDLCKDRSCTLHLPVSVQVAGDQLSAVPTLPLAAGWVYWRVRASAGAQPVASATWQFWVGARSASTAADTGNGTVLDVNGDGYTDFLVASAYCNTHDVFGEGAAHVYLGSAKAGADAWNDTAGARRIDLAFPEGAPGSFGNQVASVGDVNGDGYGDFVVGGEGEASSDDGAYVYLGGASVAATDWNGPSAPRRINLITPLHLARFSEVVTGAGDVNGDGYADFVISTSSQAFLYLGAAAPTTVTWNGSLAPGRIPVTNAMASLRTIAGIGDVNADGYSDFVMKAFGPIMIFLGSADPGPASWDGAHVDRIDLAEPAEATFWAAAGVGDVNGDGYSDFVIGASDTLITNLYLGGATVNATVWGDASAQRIGLANPYDPASRFGSAVAAAGDVNGDGYADFVIGSSGAFNTLGAASVYLGSATPSPGAWNGTSGGERIDFEGVPGNQGAFGTSAANAGDVNGDGFADFLVGMAAGLGTGKVGANLYLGGAAPSTATWTGATPAGRLDLLSPSGRDDVCFGRAVGSAPAGRF